jgi:hypothetical protein
MLLLHHRDLDRDLDHRHLDEKDHLRLLDHLICKDYLDLVHLVHQCVVGNYQVFQLLDAHFADVLQNLDEQNLDVHLTFLDVDRHLLILQVVVVDAELRHQLRMDYFLDVVDAELRHQLRMDYFLDVEQQELLALPVFLLKELVHALQFAQQLQQRAQPLARQDQRRVLLQVLQPILDLLLPFSLQQSSWQLLS